MKLKRTALIAFSTLLPAVASFAQNFQDSRHPAGPQAAHIHELWLLMLTICTVAYVATMIALVLALMRARRGDARTPPDLASLEVTERGPLRTVSTGVGVTVVLLIVLLVASVLTDRALARLPLGDPVTIKLIGHQWWWEARYEDPQPSRVFNTANEIHVPVGRPVVMTLTADDVIHSFWVPNLHGKRDLIPGHTAITQFRADTPGVYRGQCAEFCGLQHAKMALLVIAEPADQYEQWAQQQRQSAPRPSEPLAQRGEQVFMSTTCVMCHAIQGTDANGQKAPDLTHLAARRTLAAGMFENKPAQLAAWILDPQTLKPGVNMPRNPLGADDLNALVAYLGTLH